MRKPVSWTVFWYLQTVGILHVFKKSIYHRLHWKPYTIDCVSIERSIFPSLRGLNSMLLRFFLPPSILSLSLPISLSHWTWIENFQSFHLINRESFPSLFILLRNSLFYGQILLFSSHKKIIIISSEFSRFKYHFFFAGVVFVLLSDYSVFSYSTETALDICGTCYVYLALSLSISSLPKGAEILVILLNAKRFFLLFLVKKL